MTPDPADAAQVFSTLTGAATIVFTQKTLKSTQAYAAIVQAFPGADKWAHWAIAAVGSLIVALGIHITYNWNANEGGTVLFAIPGVSALLHGFLDFFKTYIWQHTIYSTVHEPPYHPPPANPPPVLKGAA